MILTQIITLGLVSATISFTVSWTGIFEPLREYIARIHPKLDELIHCPYCFNMWVMFVLSALLAEWQYFLLLAFGGQAVAGMVHFVLLRAYKPVVKAKAYRKIQRLKEEKK